MAKVAAVMTVCVASMLAASAFVAFIEPGRCCRFSNAPSAKNIDVQFLLSRDTNNAMLLCRTSTALERIVVFTSNHPESLDPALLRSGRMDLHMELPYCSFEVTVLQLLEMFSQSLSLMKCVHWNHDSLTGLPIASVSARHVVWHMSFRR